MSLHCLSCLPSVALAKEGAQPKGSEANHTTTLTLYPKALGFMPGVHNSIPFAKPRHLPVRRSHGEVG
ncbi:MAG: hypothetical protein ACYS6K_29375 [Planctomycetota bacterium]